MESSWSSGAKHTLGNSVQGSENSQKWFLNICVGLVSGGGEGVELILRPKLCSSEV